VIFRLDREILFPPVELAEPDGLLAVGGDLSPQRLILAYSSGIFPWHDRPLMWYSPDPRMVLDLTSYAPAKTLLRLVRKKRFEVRYDCDFASVIGACRQTRSDGTWISPAFLRAYERLHEMGLAHSVETWLDGKLVGGLYGVSLGSAFFGESMFHTVTDASKIAFFALVRQLQSWNFGLLDCQVENPHLVSLGGTNVSRRDYLDSLASALTSETRTGSWSFHSPGFELLSI
jgi:leucyl/phenylalanyl-tRNA--protein transferase